MIVFTFIVFCIEITENSADPDQMQHSVLFELGPYCLHTSPKRTSTLKRVSVLMVGLKS